MLNVKRINFSYGNKRIIKDISFSIDHGQFITIIGPNGAGKTTLLNLLIHFLAPDSGEIYFFGRALYEYSFIELSKIIAYVPQDINIRFPYTCIDIVSMGRKPFKDKFEKLNNEDLDIIYKSMVAADVLHLADSLINEISGGERQRVLFAKALSQTPKVLFLDEAFSAMDINYRIKCLSLLKNMVLKDGISVISIMHDLNMADIYSDIIIALDKGKVARYGKRKDILAADFINSLFKVRIKKVGKLGLIVLPEIIGSR